MQNANTTPVFWQIGANLGYGFYSIYRDFPAVAEGGKHPEL